MTLEAFRLGNFKAFADTQRVPLRPITLIYGANSTGKSSILHGLALAHHAVETGDLDTQRTQIGGESIDLGGFRQYVHRRERGRQVELAFELEPRRMSGRVAQLLRAARQVVVEIGIGTAAGESALNASDENVRSAQSNSSAHIQRFAIAADGESLLTMSVRRGGVLRLDQLNHGHRVFRELFRGLLMLGTTTQEVRDDDLSALAEVLDALVPNIIARVTGLFPRIEEEVAGSETEREAIETLVPVSRGRRREDLGVAARLFLPKALRDLVSGLGDAIDEEIRRLRYLGPLRSYPPRHLAFTQHYDLNWFAGGGYAWDVVRTRENVRSRVNSWLGDAARLATPYELEVRDLVPAPHIAAEIPSKLGVSLHDFARWLLARLGGEQQSELLALATQVAREDDESDPEIYRQLDEPQLAGSPLPEVDALIAAASEVDLISERWVREIVSARSDVFQDLVLLDKRTGTQVSHRDVGIGISQVLPVLVSAYASTNKLIAIEQPEIHLHPALQAELGDLFLGAALGSGHNHLLIETHSEHLLLRIMRRMRETHERKLPDGAHEVRPENVMVLFVEADGPRSIVREMALNERGELVKAWPGGFFEEGLREIF